MNDIYAYAARMIREGRDRWASVSMIQPRRRQGMDWALFADYAQRDAEITAIAQDFTQVEARAIRGLEATQVIVDDLSIPTLEEIRADMRQRLIEAGQVRMEQYRNSQWHVDHVPSFFNTQATPETPNPVMENHGMIFPNPWTNDLKGYPMDIGGELNQPLFKVLTQMRSNGAQDIRLSAEGEMLSLKPENTPDAPADSLTNNPWTSNNTNTSSARYATDRGDMYHNATLQPQVAGWFAERELFTEALVDGISTRMAPGCMPRTHILLPLEPAPEGGINQLIEQGLADRLIVGISHTKGKLYRIDSVTDSNITIRPLCDPLGAPTRINTNRTFHWAAPDQPVFVLGLLPHTTARYARFTESREDVPKAISNEWMMENIPNYQNSLNILQEVMGQNEQHWLYRNLMLAHFPQLFGLTYQDAFLRLGHNSLIDMVDNLSSRRRRTLHRFQPVIVDKDKIRFYRDADAANRDRATTAKPGKFFRLALGNDATDDLVKELVTRYQAMTARPEFKVGFTKEDFDLVFTKGPSSCMTYVQHRYYGLQEMPQGTRPTDPLINGDVGVAYLLQGGRVAARTLVVESTKRFVRIYKADYCTNNMMIQFKQGLREAGYSQDDRALVGQRLVKIPVPDEAFSSDLNSHLEAHGYDDLSAGQDLEVYVCPYIDNGNFSIRVHDDHLEVLGRNFGYCPSDQRRLYEEVFRGSNDPTVGTRLGQSYYQAGIAATIRLGYEVVQQPQAPTAPQAPDMGHRIYTRRGIITDGLYSREAANAELGADPQIAQILRNGELLTVWAHPDAVASRNGVRFVVTHRPTIEHFRTMPAPAPEEGYRVYEGNNEYTIGANYNRAQARNMLGVDNADGVIRALAYFRNEEVTVWANEVHTGTLNGVLCVIDDEATYDYYNEDRSESGIHHIWYPERDEFSVGPVDHDRAARALVSETIYETYAWRRNQLVTVWARPQDTQQIGVERFITGHPLTNDYLAEREPVPVEEDIEEPTLRVFMPGASPAYSISPRTRESAAALIHVGSEDLTIAHAHRWNNTFRAWVPFSHAINVDGQWYVNHEETRNHYGIVESVDDDGDTFYCFAEEIHNAVGF